MCATHLLSLNFDPFHLYTVCCMTVKVIVHFFHCSKRTEVYVVFLDNKLMSVYTPQRQKPYIKTYYLSLSRLYDYTAAKSFVFSTGC